MQLSPMTIKYLPGLECVEDGDGEDILDDDKIRIVVETVETARTEHKPVLQVKNNNNPFNIYLLQCQGDQNLQ